MGFTPLLAIVLAVTASPSATATLDRVGNPAGSSGLTSVGGLFIGLVLIGAVLLLRARLLRGPEDRG